MNESFNYNKNSNNKKVPIIICITIIVCILVFVFFKFIKDDKKSINNNSSISTNTNNNVITNSNNTSKLDKNGSFLMAIEDAFYITGRGTIVTGQIERGTINLNDTIQIIGLKDEIKTAIVTSIEMDKKLLNTAEAGDNVGLLLKDIDKNEVKKGQVLAEPNSIKSVSKFVANVYVLTKEEGGRHTPFFNDYKPKFHFRTTDITGVIELPSNTEIVNPGVTASMTIELTSPVAMEVGTNFSIKDGDRTVGQGTVTNIY